MSIAHNIHYHSDYLLPQIEAMIQSPLNAISPIDGRYADKTALLSPYFSEFALIRYRLLVEIEWLISLASNPAIQDIPAMAPNLIEQLRAIFKQFNDSDTLAVKRYEKETNHDVKAVEYYLRDRLNAVSNLSQYAAFIHFACTSEDINNVAYALMVNESMHDVIYPHLDELMQQLVSLGKKHADVSMLSRTHGQSATPSTLGKEIINIAARLNRPLQQLKIPYITAKFNGAVGNYNAHVVAYPNVDWVNHCQMFIESLGLSFNAYTTQIEPHDYIAELAHIMIRSNNILLDYCRDTWQYISMGYFKQKTIAHEVGSSTMPHKVNPIDFENAEGNLGLSNAMFEHFAMKLPISRLQRDLSDSTVLRNLGVAFSYALIAYQSIQKGMNKLRIDATTIAADLEANWDVLAEAVQTIMRRYQIPNAYEVIRDLTRGTLTTKDTLQACIAQLNIPKKAKQQLLALRPETYTGLAEALVVAFEYE